MHEYYDYKKGIVGLTHSVYSRACLLCFIGSEPEVVLSDLSVESTKIPGILFARLVHAWL